MYKKYDNDNAHIFKLLKYIFTHYLSRYWKKIVDSLY